MLGLHCCGPAFSGYGNQELLLLPLGAQASHCGAEALGGAGFGSCHAGSVVVVPGL